MNHGALYEPIMEIMGVDRLDPGPQIYVMKTLKSRQATIFKMVHCPFWDDDNWVVATQIFVYFHPYLGKLMIQIDEYFWDGLKPPTR